MDRREFIKSCSIMVAMSMLAGCRKLPLFEEGKKNFPRLDEFEKELKLALSTSKPEYKLVEIPMPGMLKQPGASNKNRFGMAIDLDACNGCGQCVMACIKENNIPLSTKENAQKGAFMHWIDFHGKAPSMCFHCGDAPCEKVCPTGAANHTPDGLSAMMYKRCAGSRFCGANCPVGARKFNGVDPVAEGLSLKFNEKVPLREMGVMEKCSLCLQRLQDDKLSFKSRNPSETWTGKGVKTACAESCPNNAIVFGNWLDGESPLVRVAQSRKLYAPSLIAPFDPSIVYMRGNR